MMGIKAVNKRQSKYEFREDSSSSTAVSAAPLLRLSRIINVIVCAAWIQTLSQTHVDRSNCLFCPSCVHLYLLGCKR